MFTYLPSLVASRFRLLIALCVCCLSISAQAAAPSAEISAAVAKAGASNVEAATPSQFLSAFKSVLSRHDGSRAPSFVSAAARLRPDLAPQIVAAAVAGHRSEVTSTSDGKQLMDAKHVADTCDWVDPIIHSAIKAAPDSTHAIVKAAIDADPAVRECVLRAAGMSGTETAWFRPAGVDAGNINSTALGSINPGNFQGQGQGNARSPEQERVTICHGGQTLEVPRRAARRHLQDHSGDTEGACP